MGYFNPFYYLKYLLKRLPKKILVFICIFLIICLCHLKGYCTDVDVNNLPNTDVFQYIKFSYEQDFYLLFRNQIQYARNNNNTFSSDFQYFCNRLINYGDRISWFVSRDYKDYFFRNADGQTALETDVETILFGYTFDDVQTYNTDAYFIIPGSYNFPQANIGSQWRLTEPSTNTNFIWGIKHSASGYSFQSRLRGKIYYPYQLEKYIPTDLYNICESIGNNTFDFDTTNSKLDDISQKIDETNEQLEELNNFFNNDTTPTITTNDLPTDTMSDITSSGINGIFTKIYNKTTNSNVETISITIPYLDYTFTISSNYVQIQLSNWGLVLPNGTSLVYLIHIIWSYFIYRYIVLDIYSYINDIKNGNISKTDTNIKADML